MSRASRPARALFETARREAERISFAVDVDHLVLACAIEGALDIEPEAVRDRIVADERERLGSLGISRDDVRAALGASDCLPVSPEAKRILELAAHRRRELTAPQLLETLREHSPNARRLLASLDEPR